MTKKIIKKTVGKKFVINYGIRMLFPFYMFLFSAFLVCFGLASSVEVQERGTEWGRKRTKLRHPSRPTKGNTVTVETETTLSPADSSFTPWRKAEKLGQADVPQLTVVRNLEFPVFSAASFRWAA